MECRTHLQIRLDQFEPPVHGMVGKRRDSRLRERESSVDTWKSSTSAPKDISREVPFDDRASDSSEVSSVSMPDLQSAVHENDDDPLPSPRTSTVSDISKVSQPEKVHDVTSTSDMAATASSLINHVGRRSSLPDLSQPRPDIPRQKAYSFDGDVQNPVTNPSAPAPAPKAVPSASDYPVVQGRIVSPQYAQIGGAWTPQTTTFPSGASTIPQCIKLDAPQLDSTRKLSNVTAPVVQANAALGLMYPDFLRKRIVPGKHMVVSDEVDHTLLMETERERPTRGGCCEWRYWCAIKVEERQIRREGRYME